MMIGAGLILCLKIKTMFLPFFCVHLSIEKICKAIWVKDNVSSFPPRIHDLVRIMEGTRAEKGRN